MRVCLVSREVAPFFGAGIGAYITEMARAWRDAGHDVHILTAPHDSVRTFLGGDHSNPAAMRLAGIHLHITEPAEPLPAVGFERYAWTVYRSLHVLHQEHQFEYIEFPDYGAEGAFAIAARSLGQFDDALLAVRLHTSTRICRQLNGESWLHPDTAALQCAEERAIADADAILSPTAALLDRGGGHPRSRQVRAVVPYPLDIAAIRLPSSDASPEASPLVLYFGRLERRKGVDLLMKAGIQLLEQGHNFSIRVIGGDTRSGPRGGSMLDHLLGLISEPFRSRFEFREALPREQIVQHIGEAIARRGLCCFPSRWENFPNACIEAMALGAPVVGSRRGGMAEIIEDGISGLLFDPGVADLAAKLAALLGDEALRARLAAAAPARVAHLCEPGRIVQLTIDAISQLRHSTSDVFRPAPTIDAVLDDPATCADLCSRIHSTAADWIMIVQPNVELTSDAAATLAKACGRLPAEISLVSCASGHEGMIHLPRLERETVLAHFHADPLVVCRTQAAREALAAGDLPGVPREVQCWTLSAILAAKSQVAVLPEVLARGPSRPIPEAMRPALTAQLAHICPELATGAVPLQLLAWTLAQQRLAAAKEFADLRSTLHEQLSHARAESEERLHRVEALEEQLASLRYKLADRVNDAMKSVGVQGVVKSVASRLGGEEKRP